MRNRIYLILLLVMTSNIVRAQDHEQTYYPVSNPIVKENLEKWEDYVQFTHNQIMELMTDYGKVDILWLDGGWVQKMTPENTVPKEMLPYPWESCIIMGGGWSYSFDAKFKTGRELVHMLIDIVAKGGNLLLNIGPGPEGTWQDDAYDRLAKMGAWMDINGEAIYETRKIEPYYDGQLYFTQKKDGSSIYIIYTLKEGESLPAKIELKSINLPSKPKLEVLGQKGKVKIVNSDQGAFISIPKKLQSNTPHKYAVVFKIS